MIQCLTSTSLISASERIKQTPVKKYHWAPSPLPWNLPQLLLTNFLSSIGVPDETHISEDSKLTSADEKKSDVSLSSSGLPQLELLSFPAPFLYIQTSQFHFPSQLLSISLCKYVTYSFFLPSVGHLGCFHAVSILNRATMNMNGRYLCSKIQNPVGICPRVVWLSSSCD